MSVQAEMLRKQTIPALDITNYWQPFGLSQDPFSTTIDGIYYSLPRWEEYLDLLQYLCHYNNVVIVVTGVNGSGKTTLMKQFITQSKDTFHICQITADTAFNTQRLIELMGDAFDLPNNQAEILEDQLDLQLAKIQESSKACILVIDDAHLLPAEILRTLLYLIGQQSASQMRLHIVFYGEPQLQMSLTRLTQIEGNSDLIHSIILEPLALEEAECYIHHRLQAAGLKEEMPLSQLEIARIFKLSEGVPGRINRIARRTLLNSLSRQQTETPSGFIANHKTKLLGGLLLLFLLASMISMLNWLDKHHARSARIMVSANTNLLPPQLVAMNDVVVTSQQAATLSNQNDSPVQVAEQQPQLPVTNETKLPQSPVDKPAVVQAAPTAAATNKIIAPIGGKSQPLPVAQSKIKPKIKSVVRVQYKKMPAKTKQFLLAVTGHAYGLQLIGMNNEPSIKQFIAKHHLQNKASYYHTTLNGKNLYVLIYGQYKTRAEAQKAIKTLPVALQNLKPWPKKFSAIHSAMEVSPKKAIIIK